MTTGDLAHEPVARMSTWLSIVVTVAGTLALAGLVTPGRTGLGFATAAVVTVVVAPLARVVWLVVAWWKSGDRLFVAVGAALVAVVVAGALIAVLS